MKNRTAFANYETTEIITKNNMKMIIYIQVVIFYIQIMNHRKLHLYLAEKEGKILIYKELIEYQF